MFTSASDNAEPGVWIVRDREFILGNESLVAEPAEDRAHANHPEARHFDGAECAHAGGAEDRCPGMKGREDLQRRNREAVQKLAVDDAHDRRPLLQRGNQVPATDRRTIAGFGQDSLCLGNRQARSHEHQRARHSR